MAISMYKASVPIFVQFLTSLSAWLDKAAAHRFGTAPQSVSALTYARCARPVPISKGMDADLPSLDQLRSNAAEWRLNQITREPFKRTGHSVHNSAKRYHVYDQIFHSDQLI